MKIIVIGCGVIGLSSGIRLLEAGHEVAIWARDLPPHTTSNIAAAIWYPYKVAPEAKVVEWGRHSYRVFKELAAQPDTGVTIHGGFDLFRQPTPAPAWADFVGNFRQARPDELPTGYTDGHYFEVPVIETPVYMKYLRHRFEATGGSIEQRLVEDVNEPLAEADLVVNCAGLGSRQLLNDEAVYPIRGQIVRVNRELLDDTFMLEDSDDTTTYVIPRTTDCIIGGTAQTGDWSLEPDMATATDILARGSDLEPAVGQSQVLEHLVGLRPGRKEVRLEIVTGPNGKSIVHNYGHGGAGVTLSWGCAAQVCDLVSPATTTAL